MRFTSTWCSWFALSRSEKQSGFSREKEFFGYCRSAGIIHIMCLTVVSIQETSEFVLWLVGTSCNTRGLWNDKILTYYCHDGWGGWNSCIGVHKTCNVKPRGLSQLLEWAENIDENGNTKKAGNGTELTSVHGYVENFPFSCEEAFVGRRVDTEKILIIWLFLYGNFPNHIWILIVILIVVQNLQDWKCWRDNFLWSVAVYVR